MYVTYLTKQFHKKYLLCSLMNLPFGCLQLLSRTFYLRYQNLLVTYRLQSVSTSDLCVLTFFLNYISCYLRHRYLLIVRMFRISKIPNRIMSIYTRNLMK